MHLHLLTPPFATTTTTTTTNPKIGESYPIERPALAWTLASRAIDRYISAPAPVANINNKRKAMAGHHTPQAQQAQAAAEQRLLGLHEQLWGLATELLLPEEDKAGAADRPSPPPRAPRAIIEVG